ncbi:MFS transporter [Actinosynnema mirum]|uniref:NUDIX hydrolase n=1 Tax=Actinosynnema mirum (strain ATCC 29888 / DSM 43827 / JCM 3225 / NBRC 14064 / NCIMB 13271 / NRRL B-12336 / IMRU 3971 / 101) TaxID=446462 RepID=C6W9X3_ACTMD|nr:MFS transporter [Actinosynnema mirum]ACU37340.1 NUDIX hydrolase [Actinosynnema mirum DSM 43827]
MPKPADNSARERRALLTTAALGFLTLGALASATGPTLPTLGARLHLTPTHTAWLLATFAAGAVLGAATTGALRHTPPGPQLTAAAALATTGSAALPLAPNLPTTLTCLLLIGTGFGAANLVLNLTLARRHGGGATLTAVSATFGLGATATPLIAATTPTDPRPAHWTCAALALTLLAATTRLRTPAAPAALTAPQTPATPPPARTPTAAPTTALLATTLLGYVALEGATTGWATTHLTATTTLTTTWTTAAPALIWLALTAGRLATAPLLRHTHPATITLTALTAAAATTTLTLNPTTAAAGYALTGLAIAPVFPAVIAWHTTTNPDDRGTTHVITAALAGPLVTAPATGHLITTTGPHAIPWTLTALALLTATTAALTRRRRAPRPEPEGVQIILVNTRDEVLLQLRDDKPGIPHPNTWCIPGGHLDPGETPRQAATRELNEEMGLTIPAHHLHHITSTRRAYGYEHTYWTRLDVDPTTIDLTEGQRVQHFTAAQTATMALGYEDNTVLAAFHAHLSTEPETAP